MQRRLDTKNYARTYDVHDLPSLIEVQLNSFNWFREEGLGELFSEISPIESFNGSLKLYFPGFGPETEEFGLKYWFEEPKYGEDICLERDMTYAAPLYVRVALVNREAGDEVVTSDIFLGDFPLMTENGTFIINGTERVVVSQLIRSPGVYFDAEEDRTTGRLLANAKLIPDRGAWMEFETRKSDYITIKFNRKRTIPVTVLLRALTAVRRVMNDLAPLKTVTDEDLSDIYKDVMKYPGHQGLPATIKVERQWEQRERQTTGEAPLFASFTRMRPRGPSTLDKARPYLESELCEHGRYPREPVGR